MDRQILEDKLIRLGSLEVNIFREELAMRDVSELVTEVDAIRNQILCAFDDLERTPMTPIEALKAFFSDSDNFPELINALEHQIMDLQESVNDKIREVSDKLDKRHF